MCDCLTAVSGCHGDVVSIGVRDFTHDGDSNFIITISVVGGIISGLGFLMNGLFIEANLG